MEEGKYALENKQIEVATENFSRAIIEENYNDPEYWYLLAESLFYQAKFDDSLECWKEAARLDPTNKNTWVKISALYALMEQDDLAIHYFEISEKLSIDEH
ncbi:MAG: tetratricopeptide repeat protein [Candidatus Thorarchaeota archaeon]